MGPARWWWRWAAWLAGDGSGPVVVYVGCLAEGMGPARWWCMWAAWLAGDVSGSGDGVPGSPAGVAHPALGNAPGLPAGVANPLRVTYLGGQRAVAHPAWASTLGPMTAGPSLPLAEHAILAILSERPPP